MSDNIFTGKEAREALMRGIIKARDVIAGTFGPTGSSVIVESPLFPGHAIYDDGYLALKAIKLEDPLEQRGVQLLLEAVEKSNKESGDGSTTATLLTAAILEEGMKLGVSGRKVKDSLDACVPEIEKALKAMSKQITPEEIGPVATIASGDPEMGTLLQEIYTQVGKDGVVELDFSKTPQTFYEIVDGVRLHNCGWMYPFMTNDGKGTKAVLKNSKILITKQKINVDKDLDLLFQVLSGAGINELVIFCEDIEPSVLQTLALAHQQSLFKTYVIKAPTLWKDWLFEDFAKITGATIVDVSEGHSFKRMQEIIKTTGRVDWLGTCEEIIISKDQTLVLGIKDISAHLANLQEAGKTDDQQLLRASWLQTKTAILKIGASSESELSLKRAKIEDARNAAYQALQNGVVPGAGMALIKCVKSLIERNATSILTMALQSPFEQLRENMGQEAFSEAIKDKSIVDPLNVPLNAIRNAISVAGTVLTADAIITLAK